MKVGERITLMDGTVCQVVDKFQEWQTKGWWVEKEAGLKISRPESRDDMWSSKSEHDLFNTYHCLCPVDELDTEEGALPPRKVLGRATLPDGTRVVAVKWEDVRGVPSWTSETVDSLYCPGREALYHHHDKENDWVHWIVDPEEGAPTDPINAPSHYTHGPVEVIEAIEAWGLGFRLGNVVKYVARADHKGNRLEDLRKARWYLDREISKTEGDQGIPGLSSEEDPK